MSSGTLNPGGKSKSPTKSAAKSPAKSPAKPAAAGATGGKTRLEHDLLGDTAVPAEAYYGVQTARAMENFNISGVPIKQYPDLVAKYPIVFSGPAPHVFLERQRDAIAQRGEHAP